MVRRIALFAAVVLLVAATASATTFVVPKDRHLIEQAEAIVIGTAQNSYTQLTEGGGIETVTNVTVQSVLKGDVGGETIKVYSPGGVYGDRAMIAAAAPRFLDGEKVILFIGKPSKGRWMVLDLALGKFSRATDADGHKVAVRQEADINGWTIDGATYRERRRDEAKFLEFIRRVVAGQDGDEEGYFLPADHRGPKVDSDQILVLTTFTPSSYLFSLNARWPSFPRSFSHTNTIPNAPAGGNTAITTAMGLWNDDAQSNVTYQHSGLDASKTAGTFGSDSANAIRWEVDLTSIGAQAFNCATGGVLGYANIFVSFSQHPGPGGLFNTITEGDVDMNQGLNSCAPLIASNTFTLGLTHELGHTMGFRHADENPEGGACTAPNECVPQATNPEGPGPYAVMRAAIKSGLSLALLSYDQNAVRAVYPLAAGPLPPTNVQIFAVTSSQISVSWSASDGATSYKVFRRTGGGAFVFVANVNVGTSYGDTTADPNTAYQYMVHAVNGSGESGDSLPSGFALRPAFTDTMAAGVTVKAVHFTELLTAVNSIRALGGLAAYAFEGSTPGPGVAVTKNHLTGLRQALDEGRQAVGASALSYGETVVSGTTVKASHISELRSGVQQ